MRNLLLISGIVALVVAASGCTLPAGSFMEGDCGKYYESTSGLSSQQVPGVYKFIYSGGYGTSPFRGSATIPWDSIDAAATTCSIDGSAGSFSKSICSYYKGSPVYATVTIGEVICSGQANGNTVSFTFKTELEPPIPPPEPPAGIWASFLGVLQGLWSWFMGLFPLGQVVASGETAVAGDVFQHTFTLTNTKGMALPDSDYTDGSRTWLYYGYATFNPSGVMVDSTLAEITQVMQPGAAITLPSSYTVQSTDPSGQYAVIASMVSVTSTWSTATGSWIEGAPVEVDKQAVKFTVQTITPPTAPSFDIGAWFTGLFAGIQGWLCQNLGLFC